MKRFLQTAATLVLLSTSAFAADLPSRRMPPVYVAPAPVFSWTGFYVGGQVGYGFGEDRNIVFIPAAFGGGTATGLTRAHGVIGGGHVGYNFAGIPGFGLGTGGLVVGVEGDIDGTDYREPGGSAGVISNNIQGSVRGRLGIAVDRALFYATGGAAFAEIQNQLNAVPGVFGAQSTSHNRVGWTVGGGVEYAITTQWSLRAEYRYSDFGSFTDTFNLGRTVGNVPIAFQQKVQRVQVGFSYKFETPVVPVVARY